MLILTQIRQQNFMIENKEFFVYSVGANCVRPPELWLNHKPDICFLYGKNIGCLREIPVNWSGRPMVAPT